MFWSPLEKHKLLTLFCENDSEGVHVRRNHTNAALASIMKDSTLSSDTPCSDRTVQYFLMSILANTYDSTNSTIFGHWYENYDCRFLYSEVELEEFFTTV